MAEKGHFQFGELLRRLRETASKRNGHPARRVTALAVATEVGMNQNTLSEIESGLYLPGRVKQDRENVFHKLMESLAVGRRTPEYNTARDLLVRETLKQSGISEDEIRAFAQSYTGDADLERRVQDILNS